MKVVYIQDRGDKGGATNSLKEMVLNLSKIHQVQPIILTSEYNSVNDFANQHGIENYAIGHQAFLITPGNTKIKQILKRILKPILYLKYTIANTKAMKKAEKSIDFNTVDLIHTNVNRNDIGAKIAKKYNKPHVWHVREFGDLDYKVLSLKKDYIKYMNGFASDFIAISNAIEKHWENKGLNAGKLHVIYNGIDNSKINGLSKRNKNEKTKIIFTGFITENKGQLQALKAISLLDDSIKKNVVLDIYGGGEEVYIEELKKFICDNHLQENVFFKGYDREVMSKIKDYDIGLMCSKSEGFGRVTIEYMLNGVCVIASNTGANPELIDDSTTGLLYEYNHVEDLKNKLEKIITDEELYNQIRVCAYDTAVNRFTSIVNCSNVYQLYEQILEKGGNNNG